MRSVFSGYKAHAHKVLSILKSCQVHELFMSLEALILHSCCKKSTRYDIQILPQVFNKNSPCALHSE